jgi:hypothetical protein
MAYSDFTLDSVQKVLGIHLQTGILFEAVDCLEVPPWLQEALRKGRELALLSEKARSELIVMPILLTCRELCGNRFAIYSGERMDVDAERGLVGLCDFILTTTPPLPFLESPIVTIVEAKNQYIEGGLGQGAAQMVGAQLFNRKEGKETATIYGCVTTGEAWQFLRLENTTIVIDQNRYYIDSVGTILGVFQAIIASCEPDSVAA